MSTRPVELEDIQGLVRFGYKHHREACFLLLRVKERAAARGWLASAPVSTSVEITPPPATALHVALTSEGLRALGVASDIVNGFSAEFVAGMTGDESRTRRLGDVGPNAPDRWQWGAGSQVPHVLALLYALPGQLAAWQRTIESHTAAGFDVMRALTTSDMQGSEPFGFRDGISQPELDWQRSRAVADHDRLEYENLTCLGEFLLGYPNEYAGYTDRPLLDRARHGASLLPRAEDDPSKADLGRNGSYLVMRQFQQDVHGFWRFLDRQAKGDAGLREQLAAAIVGRTRAGAPLVGAPTPGNNDFTYRDDPRGVRCPLGAHIRRANPRTADLPPGPTNCISRLVRMLGFDRTALEQDLVASTRFHRLLRRGREYGEAVSISDALEGRARGDSPGLHFICLNANLVRQFEFVQNAWMAGTKFAGLPDESDPLLGPRQPTAEGTPTDGFSMPQADGPDRRLSGLPAFVTVIGGAYFFLPGVRALRFLATGGSV